MIPLKLAVIGAGHLGRIHARLLRDQDDVSLVAVADPDPAARRSVMDELQVATVDHHDELLGHIDAAMVAAPTVHHAAIARDLLRRGIHVFIEKPFTTTVADADDLLRIAEDRRLIVQVGHVERYNPAFVAATPLLQEVRHVEGVRANGYTCRSTDVGVVLDLMIHDIDLVLSLVDSPVVQVQATGAVVLGPHEDMAEARITFANGCVANLSASRLSLTSERRMRFFSRDAYVAVDFGQKTARAIRPSARLIHGVHLDQMTREQRDELKTRLFVDYLPASELPVSNGNAIADEQRDFLGSVRTGRPPRVTGQDARRALVVAAKIQAEIASFRRHRIDRPTELRKAG
ncbi:MAG: Gfo/Idh/MocA family oxidoreductase [Planctomycetes bacterium]|nr:Gfo/Idh/MocA family oxidoreductase [Planctomycetota bacterium]